VDGIDELLRTITGQRARQKPDLGPNPPPPPATRRPAVWLAIALVGVVVLVLGLVLSRLNPSASPGSPTTGSGAPPTGNSSSTPRATTSEPPTSNPPTPAAVRVWWHGTLTLDGNGGATGWFLDPVPPTPAPLGDLGLSCDVSCTPNKVFGRELAYWGGSGPPQQQECANLLNTRLGQREVDVQAGTIACFGTEGGRVGYFQVASLSASEQMHIEVTVWARR
jgi:hypothetical protein